MTNFGPLGQTIYDRTYSRPIYDEWGEYQRMENWNETVVRVVNGNAVLGPRGFIEQDEYDKLIELISELKIIPAGRHLWSSGTRDSRGLFNCFRAGWGDSISDHFTFVFDQLMLGGGVGANYSSEYLSHLMVRTAVNVTFVIDAYHPDAPRMPSFVIPYASPESLPTLVTTLKVADSREGWVTALEAILETAGGHGRMWAKGNESLVIDLSDVREAGQPIHGFGGTASGPGPLAQLLHDVAEITNDAKGRTLTPIECMDIDHAIASCVVAGNVRRSARMSILHWEDPYIMEFLNAKNDPNAHWTTNMSVEIDDEFLSLINTDTATFADGPAWALAHTVFETAVTKMFEHGEPGFYNSSLASAGEENDVRATNPCGEIALNDWEACCLGHVNLAAFDPEDTEGIHEAFELMGRFLYRATFGPVTNAHTARVENANHRIGVGIMGFQEFAANMGLSLSDIAEDERSEVSGLWLMLNDMKRSVIGTVNEYADKLGTPRPVKYTTVAPTGTVSQLAGVTPGIQAIFAKYFIRRVRFSMLELKKVRKAMTDVNYLSMEEDIYSANTVVLSFLAKDTILDRVKFPSLVQSQDELTFWEQLSIQAFVQQAYADNAISFTANFIPGNTDYNELEDALRSMLPNLKGTTVFPDIARPMSPIERISENEYELERFLTSQSIDGECATGACPVK